MNLSNRSSRDKAVPDQKVYPETIEIRGMIFHKIITLWGWKANTGFSRPRQKIQKKYVYFIIEKNKRSEITIEVPIDFLNKIWFNFLYWQLQLFNKIRKFLNFSRENDFSLILVVCSWDVGKLRNDLWVENIQFCVPFSVLFLEINIY